MANARLIAVALFLALKCLPLHAEVDDLRLVVGGID